MSVCIAYPPVFEIYPAYKFQKLTGPNISQQI